MLTPSSFRVTPRTLHAWSRGATSATFRSFRGAAARASPAAPCRSEAASCRLERLAAVRSFDPLCGGSRSRRACAPLTCGASRARAASSSARPRRRRAVARRGNIATNAGGPHAFKYGVTGAWVLGLEAVLAPGEIVAVGGPVRKDVAGYDLKSLLIGSEGTLGVITAAWLRLCRRRRLPPRGRFLRDRRGRREALGADRRERPGRGGTRVPRRRHAGGGRRLVPGRSSCRRRLPGHRGGRRVARGGRADCAPRWSRASAMGPCQFARPTPRRSCGAGETEYVRGHLPAGRQGERGRRRPVERVAEGIEGIREIGRATGSRPAPGATRATATCTRPSSSTPGDAEALDARERAVDELFELVLRLGGTLSGEHGIGAVKRTHIGRYLSPRALLLQQQIKQAFDPKNLLNPGKKM